MTPAYMARHIRQPSGCPSPKRAQHLRYVVVGLTSDCEECRGHDCVAWVHGGQPFDSLRDATEHAGCVPQLFRPYVVTLGRPMTIEG